MAKKGEIACARCEYFNGYNSTSGKIILTTACYFAMCREGVHPGQDREHLLTKSKPFDDLIQL
jgi:hypothetical protein